MSDKSKLDVIINSEKTQNFSIDFLGVSYPISLKIDYLLNEESIKIIQTFFIELENSGFNFSLHRYYSKNILFQIADCINENTFDGNNKIFSSGGFDHNEIADYYYMYCEEIAMHSITYYINKITGV